MDLSVERAWMYKPYCSNGTLSEEFIHGVETFIKFACSHPTYMNGEKIKCPCSKCKIKPFRPPATVKLHLEQNGFLPRYDNWYCHGEDLMPKEQDTVAYREFVSSVKRMRMKGKENSYSPEAEEEAQSEQSIRNGESHCIELQDQDLEDVEMRSAKLRQLLPRNTEEDEAEDAYAQVNKIDKKGRMLGPGCLSQMYLASRSRGLSTPTSQPALVSSDPVILKFQSDLQERKENQLDMDAQIKEMKRMLEQMKEHIRSRTTGFTPDQLALLPP